MIREMAGSQLTVRTRLKNGMVVRTFIGDEVGDPIYTDGIFEPATLQLIDRLLGGKDTTFFDIGAHIGLYTLTAAPLAREVHCFEPMPWVYQVLKANVKTNKLSNVTSNPLGVRDRAGISEVWQGPQENSGSGSFLRIEGFYERSYPVQCTTLDQYCQDRHLTLQRRKLLIKIDAERSELEVLRGAVGVFHYEPTVIIEFNDWSTDLEEISGFFKERKYNLAVISDSGLRPFTTITELFPQRRQSQAVNMLATPPQA